MPTRAIRVPERYAVRGEVRKNPIQQLHFDSQVETFEVFTKIVGRKHLLALKRLNQSEVLLVDRKNAPIEEVGEIFRCYNLEAVKAGANDLQGDWLLPAGPAPGELTVVAMQARCADVLRGWEGAFQVKEEVRDDAAVRSGGLRPPQIGALYAVLGHWRMSSAAATVVMPTGTGKTETMLTLFAAERFRRLIVVVPTSALRDQVARKFLTMGYLRSLGLLRPECALPVVGTLLHKPHSAEEVDQLFLRCNVLVTTMAVAGQCNEAVQRRMAEQCSHLFIDEAHHIGARTWAEFRERFSERPIVQFTATPFRNDGKYVEGRAVFSYPLRKAQADGYFKPIRFLPIDDIDPDDADEAIADGALAQLRSDHAAGLSHLIMARCEDIGKATRVHAVYEKKAPDLRPLLLHNRFSARDKREVNRE